MAELNISKQWRIEQVDSELVITGGQDAIFTIELESNEPSFFASINEPFTSEQIQLSDKLILEQLIIAEIIVPVVSPENIFEPNIKVIGNSEAVANFIRNDNYFLENSEVEPDLIILIRTNETFEEFIELVNYLSITSNHIFVDLAYNHVVSLGPLVFPQITSCVGCLKGRITSRWGDALPPLAPTSSTELLEFTRDWLKIEVKKLYESDDYTLANKTIVFDSQERTMTQNRLLTVPFCPYCNKGEVAKDGKVPNA